MNTQRFAKSLLALCGCALAATATATAAEDRVAVNFEASAGLEYDNNLAVQELDRVSNAADTATLLSAELKGRARLTDKFTLKGGYRHGRKSYREFDEFDQVLGTLSLEASYDFSLLTLGGTYHHADADLAGKPFLELQQRSLYGGKLLSERFYLRAAYNQRDKKFAGSPARDAAADGLDADFFVFFDGAASFFSIGLGVEEENARASEFDYRGLTFRGRYSKRFSLWGRDNQLQLGWRHRSRDYAKGDSAASDYLTPDNPAADYPVLGDAFDPALDSPTGSRRKDVRRSLEARWEMQLAPAISAVGKVEYGNQNSNLAGADYSETVTSLMLKASF